MKSFWALVSKDLLIYKRNRRAWLLHLIMPILLAAFFGYITGGTGKKTMGKISIAVVNQDDHALSARIQAALQKDSNLDVVILPLDQAQDKVKKAKLKLALLIPKGFAEQAQQALIGQAEKAHLPCYYDPSDTVSLSVVTGLLNQYVMEQVSQDIFGGMGNGEFVQKGIQELEKSDLSKENNQQLLQLLNQLKRVQEQQKKNPTESKFAGISSPFVVEQQVLLSGDNQEQGFNGYSHSFAGMSVQFLLFMAIDAGISILLIQKQGIWNRLLAAPVNFSTILIARAVSCAIIAMFLLGIIFTIGNLVFGVQIRGSFVGFFMLSLVFALMTASFGLMVAAYGKTPEAARGIATFATLMMVMLSGAWMPSFLFPAWLQQATLLIPLRWAVDGFDAVTWRGLGWSETMPAILVQFAFTLLFGALAVLRFRKQRL